MLKSGLREENVEEVTVVYFNLELKAPFKMGITTSSKKADLQGRGSSAEVRKIASWNGRYHLIT